MQTAQPKCVATTMAVAIALIAASLLTTARADGAHRIASGNIVIAQTSMGSPDSQFLTIPSAPAAPYVRPAPPPATAPPNYPPPPSPTQRAPVEDTLWGAIGFTADGSYSTTWKMASRPEAEAKVATKCAEYGRGSCKVVSFSGKECVALATFIGSYKRRRWALSFTAGGTSYPEAQNAAIASCNSDERSQMRCQSRIAACADGR